MAALLTGASGCYRATFYKDASTIKGEEHEEWTNFYVFGLVGTQNIDVKRFCPHGQVASVRTGGNFGTGLVGLVTIGIYTPRKVYVSCTAQGTQASSRRLELELDAAARPRTADAWQGSEPMRLAFERSGADR